MDQDVLIVPADEQAEEQPQEIQEEQTPEIPVQETPEVDPRLAAYQYFQAHPDEHQALVRAGQAMYQPQGMQEPKKPNPDDYATYEEYFKAKDEYDEWRLEQRVAALQNTYDPVVQSQAVQTVSQTLMTKYGVPEEGKQFLSNILAQAGPGMLQNLANDPISSEILGRAARDWAREKQKAPTNGRVHHAEPVAGVGPTRVQLAPGTTEGDLQVYLTMTGQDIRDPKVQAKCREHGYIQ